MDVGELLEAKGSAVFAVDSSQPISEVVNILAIAWIGAVAVADDGKNIDGILSERDVLKALDANGAEALKMKAGDLMTSDVVTCDASTPISDVVGMMIDYGVRHMPVVGDDGLEGMISMRDIVETHVQDLEREVELLRKQLQA